jgi:uncharacterized FlaG/YvyC family protein
MELHSALESLMKERIDMLELLIQRINHPPHKQDIWKILKDLLGQKLENIKKNLKEINLKIESQMNEENGEVLVKIQDTHQMMIT